MHGGNRYGTSARSSVRRRWFVVAGLVVVAAVSSAISWLVIRPAILDRATNNALLDAQDPRWDALRLCSVTPEYDRTMGRVVISLSRKDATLDLHHELLLRLPPYTQVILLLDGTNLKTIMGELRDKPYRDMVQLIPYDGKPKKGARFYWLFPEKDKLVQIDSGDRRLAAQQGSVWAQDLFEVTKAPTGELILLASEIHKSYSAVGDQSDVKVAGDNAYLARLRSIGLRVQALPITFMGGNVLVDRSEEGAIAFCGGDVLRTTRTVCRAVFDQNPSDSEISDFIKEILNVDEVVLIGRDHPQPRLMFHLDQAMTLLPDRVAAITRIVPDESEAIPDDDEIKEVQRLLDELRSVLQARGYRLLDIDTSVRNLRSCQHYVNAIPYLDARTGQRTILMPVFSSEPTEVDRLLVDRNTAVFESNGYKVVHVPTRADDIRGGIHCLVNVLD